MAERSRHDGRRTGHEDAELGARLGYALRDAHAEDHVDVARLVRETRRATAARRTKLRRFTVLAATGVAAASIPLGVQVAQRSAPSAAPPVGSTPQATPTTEVAPSPGETPKAAPAPIPDEVAPGPREFPKPLPVRYDNDPSTLVVSGQACNDVQVDPGSPEPLAGRGWTWLEEDSDRLDQLSVDLQVTRWAPGQASRELALMKANKGVCQFLNWAGVEESADTRTRWSGFFPLMDGAPEAFAVRLVGDVVVAVSVDDRDDPDGALALAERLAASTAKRVRGLGAAGGAPTPSG